MSDYIDEKSWRKSLRQPDWYIRLADDFKRLEALAAGGDSNKNAKAEAYKLVEEARRQGTLPLAKAGDDLDRERRSIDTIVIHHTKNKPGMSLDRLDAIQLLRVYGMYYSDPYEHERDFKGRPVWSGHFYNDKQVFWVYHWLIREDGKVEHILNDRYIGWHAGNWDINTRSIAICIDDNLSDKEPSDAVIKAIARIIQDRYVYVKPDRIVGHSDISDKTECPGRLFHENWRKKVLDSLS